MIFEKGLCLRDANPFFVAEGKGGQIVVDPGWIVLTNDDGIDAPGPGGAPGRHRRPGPAKGGVRPEVRALGLRACRDDPRADRDRPSGQGETAVDGTPADCVRVALHRLGPGIAWIVAGINPGGNLGTDIHHSGTVAAVREGAFRGIPGIAISHYVARGRVLDWALAAARCRRVVSALMARPPGPGRFWNVNLPHPAPGGPEPEIAFCPVDPSPLPPGVRRGSRRPPLPGRLPGAAQAARRGRGGLLRRPDRGLAGPGGRIGRSAGLAWPGPLRTRHNLKRRAIILEPGCARTDPTSSPVSWGSS